MDIEDIKIGETYNVRVQVKTKGEDYIRVTPILQGGVLSTYWPTPFALGESSAFSPIPTEPAPKYDPCRKFRKGDKVEYHPKDGRELFEAKRLLAQTLTVVKNEHEEFHRVTVEAQNGDTLYVPFYYLELVTPVEELEPYSIDECGFANAVYIRKNGKTYLTIPYGSAASFLQSRAEAIAAAEAECARLNAEYRKEQK